MAKLLDEMKRRVRKSGRTPADIAHSASTKALPVSVWWLRKVMDGRISDPGVKRVQAVHDELM